MKEETVNIHDYIRSLRKNRKILQQDMAKELGISVKHYNQIERAKVRLEWKMLNRMLKILDAKIIIEADFTETVTKEIIKPSRHSF